MESERAKGRTRRTRRTSVRCQIRKTRISNSFGWSLTNQHAIHPSIYPSRPKSDVEFPGRRHQFTSIQLSVDRIQDRPSRSSSHPLHLLFPDWNGIGILLVADRVVFVESTSLIPPKLFGIDVVRRLVCLLSFLASSICFIWLSILQSIDL